LEKTRRKKNKKIYSYMERKKTSKRSQRKERAGASRKKQPRGGTWELQNWDLLGGKSPCIEGWKTYGRLE